MATNTRLLCRNKTVYLAHTRTCANTHLHIPCPFDRSFFPDDYSSACGRASRLQHGHQHPHHHLRHHHHHPQTVDVFLFADAAAAAAAAKSPAVVVGLPVGGRGETGYHVDVIGPPKRCGDAIGPRGPGVGVRENRRLRGRCCAGCGRCGGRWSGRCCRVPLQDEE